MYKNLVKNIIFFWYICPKSKYKIEVPIEAVKEWEEEDLWEGKSPSLPPYGEYSHFGYEKTEPIDYTNSRGYHFIYKEK